jgi:hypothetical protein
MNIDAPIVPGKAAAGIVLGSLVADFISAERPDSVRQLYSCDVFEYPNFKIWADPQTGAIVQVAVSGGYTGSTANGLRLGMTLREVAEKIGRPYEDDEDCLLIEGMPGLELETSAWKRKYSESFGDFDPDAEVTHIFVIPTKE